MFRHKLPWRARRRRIRHTVEIADWDCAIFERKWWEKRLSEAVLLDQPVSNDPEDLCPHLANRVNSPVSRLVKCLVRGGINAFIL